MQKHTHILTRQTNYVNRETTISLANSYMTSTCKAKSGNKSDPKYSFEMVIAASCVEMKKIYAFITLHTTESETKHSSIW